MLTSLNLYTTKVGSVGSFLVAAVDIEQAKAVATQWRDERGFRGNVTVKRSPDPRVVFTFCK